HHQPVQDDRPLAAEMRARLTQFVRPVMTRLAHQIASRLVQTARDLVPGLQWDGIAVLGRQGAPTLAHREWWTTRGPHATTQRDVEQRLLAGCALAWGQRVRQCGIVAMLAARGCRQR